MANATIFRDSAGKRLPSVSTIIGQEEVLPDGNVRKVQIFRHAGFVPACRGGAQDASDHH
jgi:hypothetical protein